MRAKLNSIIFAAQIGGGLRLVFSATDVQETPYRVGWSYPAKQVLGLLSGSQDRQALLCKTQREYI